MTAVSWQQAALRQAQGDRASVSWAEAESALIEAVGWLARLPDKERAFLSAGSRSCWPDVVRDVQADYADGEAEPSAALTRRAMDRLNAMLLGERAAVLAIKPDHRALVGRVLHMKRRPGPDGFGWDKVFLAEERAMRASGQGKLGVTSDALRRRYERAVGKVAVRMGVLGLGL